MKDTIYRSEPTHGRLIDAEAVMDILKSHGDYKNIVYSGERIESIIANAPTIDAVSREEAIKAVDNCRRRKNEEIAELEEKVKQQSAEAAQGWIPCSERLPSEDGHYLVCMAWKYNNMEVLRWADGWNCHRGYDGKISRESEIDRADIIAWMPLPKPYREESEVEE